MIAFSVFTLVAAAVSPSWLALDAKKQTLIDSYADILTEEDIAPVKENIDTYSYDEVERELAVCFARKNIAKNKSKNKVPLQPEDNRSGLEKLMEKYRKN